MLHTRTVVVDGVSQRRLQGVIDPGARCKSCTRVSTRVRSKSPFRRLHRAPGGRRAGILPDGNCWNASMGRARAARFKGLAQKRAGSALCALVMCYFTRLMHCERCPFITTVRNSRLVRPAGPNTCLWQSFRRMHTRHCGAGPGKATMVARTRVERSFVSRKSPCLSSTPAAGCPAIWT